MPLKINYPLPLSEDLPNASMLTDSGRVIAIDPEIMEQVL
jgi:hypothetical protein